MRADDDSLERMMKYIPGGIQQCMDDEFFTIVNMSEGFRALLGYTEEDIRERFDNKYLLMIHEDDRKRTTEEMRQQLKDSDSIAVEYRVCRKNGSVIWILDQGRLVDVAEGCRMFYCVLLDITEQKKEQEELRLSLERHKVIMDQAEDIIFEWDMKRDSMIYSSNWKKKFGYEPIREGILQKFPVAEYIHQKDSFVLMKLLTDAQSGVPYSEAELRIRDVGGNDIYSRIRLTTQYDSDGNPIKAVGVITDISEERRTRQELLERSQRDALTGLLNRNAAQQKVNEFLSTRPNVCSVMMVIDLDDFKKINDRYGHLYGDALLSDLSGELRRIFRSDDVIGRIGGDEFLVFLPAVSRENMERRLPQICENLNSIEISSSKTTVHCSAGVACYPEDGENFTRLYHSADKALYHVKKHGKGQSAFFKEEMEEEKSYEELIQCTVNNSQEMEDNSLIGVLGEYSFRMLYEAIDVNTAVKHLMEIVGRAYDVSRVYIFEEDEDGLGFRNTFEWCNNGIRGQKAGLQNPVYGSLKEYRGNFDENGLFYCGNIQNLDPRLRTSLNLFGVKALLQCAICDNGDFRGFVGFDECREKRFWTKEQIESLSLVARVLSTFLMKQRLHEQLERLKEPEAGK